ncbi:MAG: hypothetical protein EWM73_02824 [Nitrospira sp.]|nr:MAG: hypothetical protein EWM73_02824 [Nitrospira sp.]
MAKPAPVSGNPPIAIIRFLLRPNSQAKEAVNVRRPSRNRLGRTGGTYSAHRSSS